MNSTINLIFTIVGAALTLLTIYGAVKMDRKLFLSGICYFSFLPIIGESLSYNTDQAPIHIMVISIFLVQFVLTLPIKITFGPDNLAAVKIVAKISIALLIINVAATVYIFCLKAGVPAQFGYYHIVISLAIVYLIIKRISSNGTIMLK